MKSRTRYRLTVLLCLLAAPAQAWTPESQQAIAEMAARLTPPDLYRQIARNRNAYAQGVRDPFQDRDPAHHAKNADGGGKLDEVIRQTVDVAIRTIRAPRPFNEIVYRLGQVSHYLADANNPLNTAESDPQEARYYADYLYYMESIEPRVRMVFYGFRPGLSEARGLPLLLDETFGRGRSFYPLVGREYRRVSFAHGVQAFDDLSTAYGIASLSYSHAVSDIAEVLRYIWLEAGGIDTRSRLPVRGRQIIHLPREQ